MNKSYFKKIDINGKRYKLLNSLSILEDIFSLCVESNIKIINTATVKYWHRLSWNGTHRITCFQNITMGWLSPRFPAVRRLFVRLAGAVGRQSALYKENSGFAVPTLGRHISTLCGYRILFFIRNPYINRFTNHFSINS